MSLQDEVTAHSVAAEIVLLRAAARKTILVVEGGTDERLLSVFVNLEECDIVIAYGKENAVDALGVVRRRGVQGVLCILDTDYLELLNQLPNDPDIIFTDEHDLEVMLIRSSALDRLLAEMGSKDKLQALEGRGLSVRNILRDTGHPLGIFRFLSLRDGLNLTFNGLRYSFISRNTLAVNMSDMIDAVYNRSMRKCENKEGLIRAIEEYSSTPHDAWRICSGHDLTAILGRALLSFFGSHSTQAVRQEEIESKLRMAFSAIDLRATSLFHDVLRWEHAHIPFLVWRQEIRAAQ